MKKEDKIEITLQEYKELLETKGKYEELKQQTNIKYIYIYENKPYVDITPKVTWTYFSNKTQLEEK